MWFVQAFAFILEYLRSLKARKVDFALPPSHKLAAVLAEAQYYRLPGEPLASASDVVITLGNFANSTTNVVRDTQPLYYRPDAGVATS